MRGAFPLGPETCFRRQDQCCEPWLSLNQASLPPWGCCWVGGLTVGTAAGTGSMTSHLSVTVSNCWAVSGSRIRTITSSRPPVGRRPSRTWVGMREAAGKQAVAGVPGMGSGRTKVISKI